MEGPAKQKAIADVIREAEEQAKKHPELEFYFDKDCFVSAPKSQIEYSPNTSISEGAVGGRAAFPGLAAPSIFSSDTSEGAAEEGKVTPNITAPSPNFCDLCYQLTEDCDCEDFPELTDEEVSGKTGKQVRDELKEVRRGY